MLLKQSCLSCHLLIAWQDNFWLPSLYFFLPIVRIFWLSHNLGHGVIHHSSNQICSRNILYHHEQTYYISDMIHDYPSLLSVSVFTVYYCLVLSVHKKHNQKSHVGRLEVWVFRYIFCLFVVFISFHKCITVHCKHALRLQTPAPDTSLPKKMPDFISNFEFITNLLKQIKCKFV